MVTELFSAEGNEWNFFNIEGIISKEC